MVANRFSVKEIVRVYHTKCDQQKPVYVDKFLRPGFMYYTGAPGEEVKPKSGDLARVLMILVKNMFWYEDWNCAV